MYPCIHVSMYPCILVSHESMNPVSEYLSAKPGGESMRQVRGTVVDLSPAIPHGYPAPSSPFPSLRPPNHKLETTKGEDRGGVNKESFESVSLRWEAYKKTLIFGTKKKWQISQEISRLYTATMFSVKE